MIQLARYVVGQNLSTFAGSNAIETSGTAARGTSLSNSVAGRPIRPLALEPRASHFTGGPVRLDGRTYAQAT